MTATTLAIDSDVQARSRGARKTSLIRHWRPIVLLLPAFLLVTVFFGFPLIDVFYRSISDPHLGLQNYEWLVTTPVNLVVASRTFGTSLVVTFVCLLLAYPYAYLMTISSEKARQLLTVFVMMPLWTSILVRTLAWMVLLQDTGPINDFIAFLGFERIPLIRTNFGVALGMTQVLMPFMVLPLYSAMAKVDTRLVPAARSLGANPITSFFTVYLPLSKPGIVAGSITVFILGLGFYIIPSLLGSPRETMMASLIQQQISGFLQWGQGTTLGIALLIATIAALVIASKLANGISIIPGANKK